MLKQLTSNLITKPHATPTYKRHTKPVAPLPGWSPCDSWKYNSETPNSSNENKMLQMQTS